MFFPFTCLSKFLFILLKYFEEAFAQKSLAFSDIRPSFTFHL
jgi:hypothetical protein